MLLLETKSHWPALARDLAILSSPDSPFDLDEIRRTYGLADADLAAIVKVPAFQSMLKKELEAVEKAGDRAGVRYRAMTMSQALSEKLFNDAIGDKVEAKESLKFLELLYRAAGLLDQERPVTAVQTNVNLSLPLPRVGKLSHCFPAVEA